MIRQIRGTVAGTTLTSVVVEVAGFGIEVRTNAPEAFTVGSEAILATHLAVKQDGLELYGFPTALERDFFELLTSVPGVGPKTALTILRRSSPAALAGAIGKRDLDYLTKVAGVGKKSAEKMLVELADKVGDAAHDDEDGEVFDTLVALGYTERDARKALQGVPDTVTGRDARLKAALSAGR